MLLGLFFMGVGMAIDFGTLLERPLLILGYCSRAFSYLEVRAGLPVRAGPLFSARSARRRLLLADALLGQGSRSAFVVSSTARAAEVLPENWARRPDAGRGAVHGRHAGDSRPCWMAWSGASRESTRADDQIEDDGARVIIAGLRPLRRRSPAAAAGQAASRSRSWTTIRTTSTRCENSA